ncbi:MAG TPA: hypothetical protein PLO51_01490 [Candidatus Micrarchaeota archaeon]|nr:hypothetical protein [Candidatus Micrarchaeota archaeon]
MADGYVPGVCNIGKKETRKRYALAAIGLVVTAAFALVVNALALPKLYLLLAFIPLFLTFEGFYQGYFHFCAGFAARRIFDFSGSGGGRGNVADEEAHRQDMEKAKKIHLYTIITSAIITAIIYLIFK